MTKRLYTLLLMLSLTVVATGCSATTPSSKSNIESTDEKNTDLQEYTDSLGNTFSIESPEHVAVLSGSLADAWELAGGSLCAATDDYWDINTNPNEDLISLGSLKAPSVELMVQSDIDFAILSANISDQVALQKNLQTAGIPTAYFDVETFEDYAEMMKVFTDITGRSDLYQTNVTGIQDAINIQLQKADGSNPSVLLLRSYSSGIKAKGSDSMVGQMLKDLGCNNIADTDSSLLDNLSMEAIVMADPDYIFVTCMGEETAALDTLENTFQSNASWFSLTAVQNNHYYVLEKDLFQNKPNERWAESYEILANYLYEE